MIRCSGLIGPEWVSRGVAGDLEGFEYVTGIVHLQAKCLWSVPLVDHHTTCSTSG